MASFEEHISQSRKNLEYLSKINNAVNDRWDWQVTVCFYAAVHMINAHIAKKISLNYLSHKKVDDAINPYGLSPCRMDEVTYKAYTKLHQLSRRARYLTHEKQVATTGNPINVGQFTYDPHFRKAIANLDTVIEYIKSNYSESFSPIDVKCAGTGHITYKHFRATE